MPRNRFVPVFSSALLAGVLTLTGCASTATNSSATNSSATKTTAARTGMTNSADAHGTANVMIYSINSDGPGFRAVVSGAVGDYGPAVTVYPDGKVDPGHTSEMELKLTHGQFRVSIADLHQKLVKVESHEPIYPATCSDFVHLTVAVPIVTGSGTGSYRGIHGSFLMTVTIDEVNPKPCQPVTGILWQVIVLTGTGTVSF